MKIKLFRHIRFFVLSLLVIFFFSSWQQTAYAQKVKYSNEKLRVEKVPEKKIEEFRNDRDFQYMEKTPPDSSLGLILWYYFMKFLETIFSNEGAAPYIRNTIIGIIIILIIIKLLKSDISGIFGFNKKAKTDKLNYQEEEIHGIDFDKKIDKAIKNQDFRLAVRFLYLKLLHILDEKELIHWEPGATNQKYRKELKEHPIYQQFISLSRIYEYSWYGHFEPEQRHFEEFRNDFNQSFSLLNTKN